MFLSLIIGFVLGAAAIIFAFENTAFVSLTFLGWHFQSSIALVVILALAAGGILGILSALPGIIRRSWQIRTLRRDNAALQDEVATLDERIDAARKEADALRNPGGPNTVDLRRDTLA